MLRSFPFSTLSYPGFKPGTDALNHQTDYRGSRKEQADKYAGTEKIESLFHDWLCLLNGYILFINSFDLYVGRFRQVFVQVEIHTYKNDYG